MFYRRDKKGQILEDGINEAAHVQTGLLRRPPTAPTTSPCFAFYIFYSMFGFQRIGDLAWAAGDSRAKGFRWRPAWPPTER